MLNIHTLQLPLSDEEPPTQPDKGGPGPAGPSGGPPWKFYQFYLNFVQVGDHPESLISFILVLSKWGTTLKVWSV